MTVIGRAMGWPRRVTLLSTSIATSRDKTLFAWWNMWRTSRNQHKVNRLYRTFGKRALDLVVAVPALLLASPHRAGGAGRKLATGIARCVQAAATGLSGPALYAV